MPKVRIASNAKTKLWTHDLYTISDIEYIIGKKIVEYDMVDAGWNLILYYNLLPEEDIKKLNKLSKHARKIQIGKIMKVNKSFNRNLTKSFAMMRKKFFIANDIESKDVIAIKKDAIFIINKSCKVSKFKNVEFKDKHRYTSYHKFGNIEMYFNSSTKSIDIKGVSDENLIKHKKYMVSLLCGVFGMIENGSKNAFVESMKNFVQLYKERKLDTGYYRELNSYSVFTLNKEENISNYYLIGLDNISKKEINKVNISYNYMEYIFPIIQRHYFMDI